MARKGLPKKYAAHGFKKGWKLYNAAKDAAKRKRNAAKIKRTSGSTTRKKTTTRKRTTTPKPTTTIKRRSTTMAKAKRKAPVRRRRAVTVAPRRRVGRRMPKLLTAQTMNTIIDGTLIGGSAVGTTVLVNMAPVIKNQAPWIKSLVQAGTGAVALGTFKDKYIKKVSMGAIVGSAITLILPWLPVGMKAFGGRAFNQGELNSLRTLGKPFALGKPMNIPSPTMAGAGGRTSYRSRTGAR